MNLCNHLTYCFVLHHRHCFLRFLSWEVILPLLKILQRRQCPSKLTKMLNEWFAKLCNTSSAKNECWEVTFRYKKRHGTQLIVSKVLAYPTTNKWAHAIKREHLTYPLVVFKTPVFWYEIQSECFKYYLLEETQI